MHIGVFKLAVQRAEESDVFFRMGAVIFKGSRIISSGKNQFKNSGVPYRYRKSKLSIHAEQDALDGLDWNKLKGCSIFVIRVNRSGIISMAYPCEYCIQTLDHVGIKWVYYTNHVGEVKRTKI